VPQVNIPVAHPLSIVPQFLPAGHAASGVQLVAHLPFEQTIPVGQPPAIEPQFTLPPQPLGAVPQFFAPQAASALVGVHPHTLATGGEPPPQVWGAVQLPHPTLPPQPSDTASQFFPAHAVAVVFGVQPQTLAVPPPPQVRGAAHWSGHATVCPQFVTTLPHLAPFAQVCSRASGRQPHTPVTPPPPQLWPFPAQVVAQSTM
jgi:hypothetical protein